MSHSAFQEAVGKDDVEAVAKYLRLGVNPDQVWSQDHGAGWHPLFVAARRGFLAVARVLVEARANIERSNSCGTTPLHIASQRGHLHVVRYLLQKRATLHTRNLKNRTPLVSACSRRHPEVVRLLLRNEAQIDFMAIAAVRQYHEDGVDDSRCTALSYHLEHYSPLCAASARGDGFTIARLLPSASPNEMLQAVTHALDEGQSRVALSIKDIIAVGGYGLYVCHTSRSLLRIRRLMQQGRAKVRTCRYVWFGEEFLACVSPCSQAVLENELIRLMTFLFVEMPDLGFAKIVAFYL